MLSICAQQEPRRTAGRTPLSGLSRAFNRRAIHIACCSLGLLWATAVAAERGASIQSGVAEPHRFDHFSNLDGLSQVSVWSILQDHHGILWFATSDGLNRFDGYDFKVFYSNPGDPSSLSHRLIRCLLQTDDGNLWIGTGGGGLNLFDGQRGTFTHSRNQPGNPRSLSNDTVTALLSDHRGVLWIGTHEGLNRLDGHEPWNFSRFPDDPSQPLSLSHPKVLALLEDSAGNLWIATAGGLDRVSADRQSIQHFRHREGEPSSLASHAVSAMLEDGDGNLWIATRVGLDRLRADGTFTHYLPEPSDPAARSNRIRTLAANGKGGLWVGSEGGLFDFDSAAARFVAQEFATDASPAKKRIVSMTVSSEGALWLGTQFFGVYRFAPDRPHFEHYHHRDGDPGSLYYDTVYSFAEDKGGNLFVGTVGGGVNRFDAASGTFSHWRHDPEDNNSLASDRVRCLLVDAGDNLWIGTSGGGLDRLDPSRRIFTHFQEQLVPRTHDNHRVLSLLEDRTGLLWIATARGVHRYDPTSETIEPFEPFLAKVPAGNERLVMNIFEDGEGLIWFGTNSGLYSYDGQNLTRYGPQEGNAQSLSHVQAWGLLEDRQGNLWIGTAGGGLNRFDRQSRTFTRFTAEDGLGNNVVYGLQLDSFDRLWISTNRGLVRFTPETDHWIRYDRDDGLQNLEFNVGASFQDSEGRFYFGGTHGYNRFAPETIHDNPFEPPVVLTSLEIEEDENLLPSTVQQGGLIELTHRQNFFSFEFAALNYTRSDKNLYSYRLQGLEEKWSRPGPRRYASYTNVAPGRYTFRVRGSNNDGLWNTQGASIELLIHPPWWRTVWAHALYLLAVAASIAGAIHWQRQKLQRERAIASQQRSISADLEGKNAELERFVYTVSHDLKNPLVTIRNFIGLIRHGLPETSHKNLFNDLDRIDRASAHMHQMLEELVELSRIGRIINMPESTPLAQVVDQALEGLAIDFRRDSIEWIVDDDLPEVQVDRLRMQEALANLLENAMKFMGAQANPRVEVGLRERRQDLVVCFVRDNGIGVEEQYLDQVFGLFERLDPQVEGTGIGLALVKRIIEAHGGTIWLESEGLGSGSTFVFELPISQPEEGLETP